MTALPDPLWPVVLLAVIQLVDGVLCIKPAPFVAECLDDVHFPRKYWPLLPPLKFAAAAALIAGIWIPYLAALTTGALVLYFAVAISMHVWARDFGRNLFANATAMLLICVATGVFGFLV